MLIQYGFYHQMPVVTVSPQTERREHGEGMYIRTHLHKYVMHDCRITQLHQ